MADQDEIKAVEPETSKPKKKDESETTKEDSEE